MAPTTTKEANQVLFEESEGVGKIILNRPQQLNVLSHEMLSQINRAVGVYEKNPLVKLIIVKGNGKAFCVGSDLKPMFTAVTQGHWSYGASFVEKQTTLDYSLGTLNKPAVAILNGLVMGAGAGLSMHLPLRIVTEKTIFAMPELKIGGLPIFGASYFLPRLPGFLGEYIGLTGARLDGAEMLACGLATHFVFSKDLLFMEDALCSLIASGIDDFSSITETITKFARPVKVREGSVYKRMEDINNFFSRATVEEILVSLENLAADSPFEKWIKEAIIYMRSVSPTSLKLCLRLIREGRKQNLEQCFLTEYKVFRHLTRETFHSDLIEGARAIIIEKDNNPKWMPSKIEQVSNEMVEKFFFEVYDDDNWKLFQLPERHPSGSFASKL